MLPTCKECARWVRCEIEAYEGHCHDAAPKVFMDRHGRFATARPLVNADDVACRTGFVRRIGGASDGARLSPLAGIALVADTGAGR